MSEIRIAAAEGAFGLEGVTRRHRGIFGRTALFIRRYPLGSMGALILLVLVLMAILGPVFAPWGELESDRIPGEGTVRLHRPYGRHLLGTDEGGRDVFSRILIGSRISLTVGLIAVAFGTVVGGTLGTVSGFFGGKVDQIIQRIADTIMAFPGLVFLIAAVSVLGAGGDLVKTFLAIGILLWPGENRVVRSTVLAIKQNAYIEAARAIGATNQRILLRHILPNVAPIVIIVASIAIGGAILLDASLGFLGLGTVYPRASWGGMLSSGGRTYMKQAPWLALAPGFAISVAVWSFNMFGDAMRDALDPRLRGSR